MPEIILWRIANFLERTSKKISGWFVLLLLIIPLGIPILLAYMFMITLKDKIKRK